METPVEEWILDQLILELFARIKTVHHPGELAAAATLAEDHLAIHLLGRDWGNTSVKLLPNTGDWWLHQCSSPPAHPIQGLATTGLIPTVLREK